MHVSYERTSLTNRVTVLLVLTVSLTLADCTSAQEQPKPPKPQSGMTGGASSGTAHAPVKDALSRPITAGGFVDGAPVVFKDVTEKAGVANERWGFGVAIGDYDNDGWPDICVANYGKNRLYHNNHDGTFTDVAEKAGVALGGWSTGPTWGDYDHDGLLDLFVPGYVKFDPNHPPGSGKGGLAANSCQFRGVQVMCGPRGIIGERDHLFHNNGDGTFTDVSEKSGVADAPGSFGLASVFVDVDDDGWVDLLVANDSTPNYLYKNRKDGTFEDASYASGIELR